jgi:hypothetical protein
MTKREEEVVLKIEQDMYALFLGNILYTKIEFPYINITWEYNVYEKMCLFN